VLASVLQINQATWNEHIPLEEQAENRVSICSENVQTGKQICGNRVSVSVLQHSNILIGFWAKHPLNCSCQQLFTSEKYQTLKITPELFISSPGTGTFQIKNPLHLKQR